MADALKQAREDVVDVIRSWDDQTAADAALDALEAAVRASERERIAALVESKAWPHERPESENQFLYGLAEEISKQHGMEDGQ